MITAPIGLRVIAKVKNCTDLPNSVTAPATAVQIAPRRVTLHKNINARAAVCATIKPIMAAARYCNQGLACIAALAIIAKPLANPVMTGRTVANAVVIHPANS
ncbi:hypothetical protein D3C74_442980 [compost metagenome]